MITDILKKEYQYKIDRVKSYIAKNQLMLQKGINYDAERKELLANGFYTTKSYEYGEDRVNDYEPVVIDGYNSGVADYFLISSRTHVWAMQILLLPLRKSYGSKLWVYLAIIALKACGLVGHGLCAKLMKLLIWVVVVLI
ncbi:hypothetical protein [Vallitalea maricola]|uniref:Uncharacterized protein n=1 Tax=Vallitalea maricola TaxID=3074433 RepID=A0ACB5UQS5_9FIRM|nr:hypothetical protein AN2V17_34650 [Vallitalea sp. AN17-2]